jgi:Protein of unknown function (DUF3277)
MSLATYSPLTNIVNFRGHQISDFMDGTYIEVDRHDDVYKMHVGAQGVVARTHNPNRTGMIQVTLKQTSPSNDVLMGFALLDDPEGGGAVTGLGKGPILFQELNGSTIVSAADAWIRKIPKIDRGADITGVVWIFDCAILRQFVGSLPAL